jgi:hypothetical protein
MCAAGCMLWKAPHAMDAMFTAPGTCMRTPGMQEVMCVVYQGHVVEGAARNGRNVHRTRHLRPLQAWCTVCMPAVRFWFGAAGSMRSCGACLTRNFIAVCTEQAARPCQAAQPASMQAKCSQQNCIARRDFIMPATANHHQAAALIDCCAVCKLDKHCCTADGRTTTGASIRALEHRHAAPFPALFNPVPTTLRFP